MNFFLYFFLFFVYSLIGWIIEVIFVYIFTRNLSNRGFLIGPYLPIYGVAALTMHFTITNFYDYPWIIFVLSALIVTTIEYIAHFSLEKIFNTRWWDYSYLPLNVDGRVCLPHALLFGALGVIFVFLIDPFTMAQVEVIPENVLIYTSILMLIIFTVDSILSFKIISKVTETAEQIKKDRTNEINEKVKETLLQQSYLTRRLVKAFPNFRTLISYTQNTIKNTHTKLNNKINAIRNGDKDE